MKIFILLAVLLSCSSAAPIIHPQIGIIASNSNEIVRLQPRLTFSGVGLGPTQVQGTQFLSPFLIQSPPDLLLPPQVLNFGPQAPGSFLPPPQNLPPFLQQEQPTGPVNPNNLPTNNQDPGLIIPQYYPYPPFPQSPGGQGFPYYLTYGFPSRNTWLKVPPNQNTPNQNPAIQNAANQNPVGPTKVPQPAQNNGKVIELWRMTPPPDNRGDRPGRGVDGDPAFPYFQP